MKTATGISALPAERWEHSKSNVWVWHSPLGVITLVAEFDRVIIWHGEWVAKVVGSKYRTRGGVPAPRFVRLAMRWAEARYGA